MLVVTSVEEKMKWRYHPTQEDVFASSHTRIIGISDTQFIHDKPIKFTFFDKEIRISWGEKDCLLFNKWMEEYHPNEKLSQKITEAVSQFYALRKEYYDCSFLNSLDEDG